MGERFQEGVTRIRQDTGVPLEVKGLPPVFHLGLATDDPAPYTTLITQEMARRGVHMPMSVYIMAAHTPEDIDTVLAALENVMPVLRKALEQGNVEGLLETPVSKPVFRRRQV